MLHVIVDSFQQLATDYANFTFSWVKQSTFGVVLKVLFVVFEGDEGIFLCVLFDTVVEVEFLGNFLCFSVDASLHRGVCFLVVCCDVILKKLLVFVR